MSDFESTFISMFVAFTTLVLTVGALKLWKSYRGTHAPPPTQRRARRRRRAERQTVARSRATDASGDESEGGEVELRCAYCGAPVYDAEEDSPLLCSHCGSWLVARRPRDYEVLCSKLHVASVEDVRQVLIRRRLDAFRRWAETGLVDDEGRLEPQAAIDRIVEWEARLLHRRVRLGSLTRLLLVPFWRRHGLVCLAAMGEEAESSGREVRLRGVRWDRSTPAHEVPLAALSDQHGRLTLAGGRPLSRADADAGTALRVAVAQPPEADASPPRLGRRFEGFEELSKLDSEVWDRAELVFKPYWIADCRVGDAERPRVLPPEAPIEAGRWWFVVDASRGSVSGTIADDEARRVLDAPPGDPLEGRRTTELRLVTSRCPECGVDLPPEECAWVLVCRNCHQGLEVSLEGLRRVAYSHRIDEGALPGDSGWLPFWRFGFAVTDARGERLERLEDLLPGLGEAGPDGPWLWVPAVRLLGRGLGDRAFLALVRWIHAPKRAHRIEDARLPTQRHPGRLVPASLPREEARALVRSVLGGAVPERGLSRVSTELFRERVAAADLEVDEGRLVLVQASLQAKQWRLPGLVSGIPAATLAAATRASASPA